MKRYPFLLLIWLTCMSCHDKVICPAFQSAYILDDSTRNAYFSYVWQLDESTRETYLSGNSAPSTPEDSLSVAQPKTDYYAYAGEKVVPWRSAKRTKFGIIKPVFYPIKNYRLRTAPMENMFGPEIISSELVAVDSMASDSVAVASLDSTNAAPNTDKKATPKYLYGYDIDDNYNVEQAYYNKYYAYKLVDMRPDAEKNPSDSLTQNADTTQTKKPFFKRLFGGKKKEAKEEDSADEPIAEDGE